jgi:hypothetical protein
MSGSPFSNASLTGATTISGSVKFEAGTQISGLYKGSVGLGRVNNTSDMDKPVSTAVQGALDKILGNAAVLASKPALDTLSELAAAVDLAATKTYIDNGLDTKADAFNPSLSGDVSIINRTSISSQTRQKSVGRGGGDKATAISSSGQYQLVAKGGIIYVSSNSGVTFVETTFTLNTFAPNTACMSSDGSTMIVSNESGFAKKSTNFGVTWTDMNNVSGFRNIAMSSDGTKILCSKFNESMLSSNSGSTFSTIPGIGISGDGVGMSGNGQYMIIRGANSYISTNGGSTWSQITSVNLGGGWRPNVAISFTGKYMLATENPAGTNNYFSSDFGATWSTRDITPASASTETKQAMSAYRAAMSSDGKFMVIASYSEKYFYSSDFGATFVQSTIGSNPVYREPVSISDDGRYILTCDNDGFYVDLNNIALITPSLTISSMGAGIIRSDASGVLTSSLIVASDISNGAVTASKIADGAVTASKIAASALSAYALDASLNLKADASALNEKAPSASPTFTGSVILPVPTDASSNEAATTSFVMNKLYDVSNNKFSILNITIDSVIPTVGAMVFSTVDQKLYICAQDASAVVSWFDVGASKVVPV